MSQLTVVVTTSLCLIWFIGLVPAVSRAETEPDPVRRPELQPLTRDDRIPLTALVRSNPSLPPSFTPELELRVAAALTAQSDFRLLSLRRALSPAGESDAEASWHQAASALWKGRRAYEELDAHRARKLLRQACDAFEAGHAEMSDPRPTVDAHLYLASLLRQTGGDPREVAEHFRTALFLQPRLELDPDRFPPDDIAALEATRLDIARSPRGKIELEATPVSARAYVDGTYRGVTPLVVHGLAPGDHLLRLERDGYAPVAAVVDVKAQRTRRFPMSLAELQRLPELKRILDRVDPRSTDLGGAAADLTALLPGGGAIVITTELRDDGAGVDAEAHYVDFARAQRVGHARGLLPIGGPQLASATWALVTAALAPQTEGTTPSPPLANGATDPRPVVADPDASSVPWGSVLVGIGGGALIVAIVAGVLWVATTDSSSSAPAEGGRRMVVLGF